MRILGIDQSTNKVGCAIFDGDKLEKYWLIDLEKLIKKDDRFENKDYLERIALLKETVLKTVEEERIDCVVLEDIVMTSFGGKSTQVQCDTFKKLAKSLGCLEISMIDSGLYFATTPANVWRKGLGLGKKRDEIKANTIKYVNKKFGLELKEYNPKSSLNDDDIADAIGLAHFGSKNIKSKLVK